MQFFPTSPPLCLKFPFLYCIIFSNIWTRGGLPTDTNRMKRAAEWFYGNVFREESIPQRTEPESPKLPSQLRAARSLQNKVGSPWQTRETVFLKQAKLLAGYEDDYAYSAPVQRYYPTYESLTDEELRAYFTWRTRLRRGELRKTSLSYAFLYVYELINQIGVESPQEGFEKLQSFRREYGALDDHIVPYLDSWLTDYVVYYDLDHSLLEDTRQAVFDRNLSVLMNLGDHDTMAVMNAVTTLAPKWLGRSRFYGQHREDMGTVIVGTLRRISDHYTARCKKTMVEQYFGPAMEYPIRFFSSAVFLDRQRQQRPEYAMDSLCIYRCRAGLWTVWKYHLPKRSNEKLDDLMKTIDAVMRQMTEDKHPIQPALETKWILKIIREETQKLLDEKKAAQAKKVTIDFSSLHKIRRDAAFTQEKLMVDEEIEEPEEIEQIPPVQEEEGLLSKPEYRLLQSLLYGRDLGWVQAEGHMVSVLADGINEKLYDSFCDSVLEDGPELIEDYIEELKEMVHP